MLLISSTHEAEAPGGPKASQKTTQRFSVRVVIHSFTSMATFISASRSLRPNEVPCCQIVAWMFPHRSVVADRLDEWLVARVCPLHVK